MNIVIYSVVLNQHQAPIADELWNLTNHEFTFVELINLGDRKGGTQDYSARPYLLKAWENQENFQQALELCRTADCCIFAGVDSLPFEVERLKYNKLSFEMGERWFKKGAKSLLSPRLWKWLISYKIGRWSNKNLYKLCCSAFCASDHRKLYTFKDKCYKWGYFTHVEDSFKHINKLDSDKHVLRVMWCARFIDLKHPEIPIKLAARLHQYFESASTTKGNFYSSFELNMFGDGPMRNQMEHLAKELHVADFVKFHGNVPNEIIRENLRNHDLFIFTSDRGEGWGAVANEAMSEGCVIIGSDKIGSIPFLVKDGSNGFIFDDQNIDSLYGKVLKVISLKEDIRIISENGYKTIRDSWSPRSAAQSLILLIDGIKNGNFNPIKQGPCSKA